MDKHEFANKIVEQYDIDTLIESAIDGILQSWEQNSTLLEEEIKQRQDILEGEEVV
jgi:hypothetical protein